MCVHQSGITVLPPLGGLSPRRPGIVPGPVHKVFVIDTVALGGPGKLSRYTNSLRAG